MLEIFSCDFLKRMLKHLTNFEEIIDYIIYVEENLIIDKNMDSTVKNKGYLIFKLRSGMFKDLEGD